MDMIGYLGKKVDMEMTDGKKYSGYIVDVTDAEDSDIGEDSIDLDPLDKLCAIVLPSKDIKTVIVDDKYKEIDFIG